jgi:hypothetical protein
MIIDVEALELLEAQWSPTEKPPEAQRIPLRSVESLPAVYQSRQGYQVKNGVVDKNHVAALTAFLKSSGRDTDPITVLRVGKRNILIDGHHRVAAYRAEKRKDVPVIWYAGSPKQALIESGCENGKTRLPMDTMSRGERAWALVCSGVTISIADISRGSGVAARTVSNMRKRHKEYTERRLVTGQEIPETWRAVLAEAWNHNDDDGESYKVREEVEKLVKLLKGSIGPSGTFKTTGRLHLLAEALYEWGPRAMEQVTLELVRHYGFEDRVIAMLGIEAEELREEVRGLHHTVEQLNPAEF